MDAWTWTVQMLAWYGRVLDFVPPCSELAKTIHRSPDQSVYEAYRQERNAKRAARAKTAT